MKKIGLLDADLVAGHRRLPNLVLMKISTYLQQQGWKTELVTDYTEIKSYYRVFLAKVFTGTAVPTDVLDASNVVFGGTGFLYDEAVPLPDPVEHTAPDYSLYTSWAAGLNATAKRRYLDFSIGFTTRHCFRGCSFCINRKYKKVELHSPVAEFVDPSRKYIYLLDDNLLGFPGWRQILDDLDGTGKRYQYIQGLDLRLMTDEVARRLNTARYYDDFIFAFDDVNDEPIIREKLAIWRRHCHKNTKLYTFCAYKSTDAADIEDLFRRFAILAEYNAKPYVMRFERWEQSEHRGLYATIARWANQLPLYKKLSFREFCQFTAERGGEKAPNDYLRDFETKHPEITRRWFDWRYSKEK